MMYFYRDPISAAYMATNFGMKFIDNNSHAAELSTINNSIVWYYKTPRESGYSSFYGKFLMHPESLKQLEPQENDIVEFAAGGSRAICVFNQNLLKRCTLPSIEPSIYNAKGVLIFDIAKRNGIPFLWPEIEI